MKSENEARRRNWWTDLLVIQPTPFCNIDCSYCYLPYRTSTKRLSLQLAEPLFEQLFGFPTIKDRVTMVWHAGEPMVLPVGYYEDMFALVQRLTESRIDVQHSFQTNGTLITEAWCDLIAKWNVQVGVSIDGPAEFHDLHRRYRNGAGSFAKAYRGLRLLQSRGLPFHVISVLTLSSLQHPDAMFDFYEQAGVQDVCFNIEEKEAHHTNSELVDSPQFEELYRAFMQRFLELAVAPGTIRFVREFNNAFRLIQGYGEGLENSQIEPFRIISVDCEGNVSTFSPELLGMQHPAYGFFTFGNLIRDDFETIAKRVEHSKLYADIQAGVRKCRGECEYFELCGGGAPSNKIYENGSADSTETVYCRAHQIAIDVVLEMIERIPEGAQLVTTGPSIASPRRGSTDARGRVTTFHPNMVFTLAKVRFWGQERSSRSARPSAL